MDIFYVFTAGNFRASGSFLFSLRNDEDLPPFKAPLKDENDDDAIQCNPNSGPSFGGGYDLDITFTGKSSSYLDYTYQAPTAAVNKYYLLAGRDYFVPEEIEVLYLT